MVTQESFPPPTGIIFICSFLNGSLASAEPDSFGSAKQATSSLSVTLSQTWKLSAQPPLAHADFIVIKSFGVVRIPFVKKNSPKPPK